MSDVQAVGQGKEPGIQGTGTYSHEVVGSLRGCTFDISTVIPPNTYRIDGRLATPLRAGMSAIDFQRLLCEHNVLNITFAWDVRELAREVFHLLAIDFPSNRPTTIPHTVV